jgi:hypothetical protein
MICIHPNAVCADDEVRGDSTPVLKGDSASLVINALAAGGEVSAFTRAKVCWTASHMIDDDLAGNALALLRSGSVEKASVHILAIEHERRVAPSIFVVLLVVLVEQTAGLPVAHDELLEVDRFH